MKNHKQTSSFTLSLLLIILLCLPQSCTTVYHAEFKETFPRVDTKNRPIEYQARQKAYFKDSDLSFDNQFDAARMNKVWRENDSTYSVLISPENYPINSSPWYAFRVISKKRQTIWIQLNYILGKHRYIPKISSDRKEWTYVSKNWTRSSRGDSTVLFPLELTSDTTWVAAQEIYNMSDTYQWAANLTRDKTIQMHSFGASHLGRPLQYLDISSGRKKGKPIIVVLGRQHPPEITGFLAMKAFMEKILDSSEESEQFLKSYRILFYPIVNPDGVDLGNWRHNAGGIDLNRDWGNYNQPEIKQLCDHIVAESKKSRAKVILGIDFHSTQNDIFYTNYQIDGLKTNPNQSVKTKNIVSPWLYSLNFALPKDDLVIEASSTRPVSTSKNWFVEELGAEGVIYEVGDQSPRDYIKEKAQLAASLLIEILVNL